MKQRNRILRLGALILLLSLVLPFLPKVQGASLYTVKSTSTTTLAPGITQTIRTAKYPNDSRNVKYYIATADVNRSDVIVLNGFKENNPAWNRYTSDTVDNQIMASEQVHQDPNNIRYIENYRVVAGCNGGFFNIPGITGIEGVAGALVMEGVQYWPYDGRPFLAILKDGSAVVGAGTSDWNKYREDMWEAIGGNVLLVKQGVNNTGNVDEDKAFVGQESAKFGTNRHPRTCAGVTKDGKVVMMVVDAQGSASSSTSSRGGATLSEAAQMLIDAGCYYAINFDGGGSSTYMTKEEGATKPTLVNSPSGGSLRAICGSFLFASVAPSDHLSLEFDGTGSQRYMRQLYARRDYDQAEYWATGLAGTGSGDVAVVMDSTERTMSINLTRRADSHSTYFAPGAKNGNFNDAEATTATAFHFNPADAEIFRIRLKFNDAKRYSSSDTPFVGLSYLPGDTRTELLPVKWTVK